MAEWSRGDKYKRAPWRQDSSASARDGWWAFENLAKSMLRYLDNCNEVKVGITELQEWVVVPEQICISVQQVARQGVNEDGQTQFEVFWQQEGELCIASWARWEAQRKVSVDLDRRCQDISREIQMLNKRQEIFQNAIEGKLIVQDRASERMHDEIMKNLRNWCTQRTEAALQLAVKEHDLWMYQNEKEEAQRLQGSHLAWPDWEEARKLENGECRLEPEGKRKCRKSLSSDWEEARKLENGECRLEPEGKRLSNTGLRCCVHERCWEAGKEKKKVKGWSNEEMKDKPSSSWEETRTLFFFLKKKTRGDGSMLEEFDKKNGGCSSGQVQGRGQQKRGLQRQRLPAGMETCAKKQIM